MSSRERDDEITVDAGGAVGQHDHGDVGFVGDGCNDAFDVDGVVLDAARNYINSERRRCGLGRAQQVAIIDGRFWTSQKHFKCRSGHRLPGLYERAWPATLPSPSRLFSVRLGLPDLIVVRGAASHTHAHGLDRTAVSDPDTRAALLTLAVE